MRSAFAGKKPFAPRLQSPTTCITVGWLRELLVAVLRIAAYASKKGKGVTDRFSRVSKRCEESGDSGKPVTGSGHGELSVQRKPPIPFIPAWKERRKLPAGPPPASRTRSRPVEPVSVLWVRMPACLA